MILGPIKLNFVHVVCPIAISYGFFISPIGFIKMEQWSSPFRGKGCDLFLFILHPKAGHKSSRSPDKLIAYKIYFENFIWIGATSI